MNNRLSIKLISPLVLVGLFFILLTFFLPDNMSKYNVLVLIFVLVLCQFVATYLFSAKLLTSRVRALKEYLALVVSTDKAPSTPLIDNVNDELGEVTNSLSNFVVDLAEVISEIRTESEKLSSGSDDLSAQMKDSVSSLNESVSQVEQMALSIEEIASTSSELSNSAVEVSETTGQVRNALNHGVESSNTSRQTITDFATEVESMANNLALLQEESARIGSVLDVIRSIADQTNLLALNAAIEAARAGEQGRGFAVVADEVRALAHRTQEATVEIQSMVEGLQDKTSNAVSAVAKGQYLSQTSLSQSAEVVSALEQIGEVYESVDTLTAQIAGGTKEQQSATASINDNMAALVSLNREINEGLLTVTEHASQQQQTSAEVDVTLNRICV